MYIYVQFVRLVFDPLVFTCISVDTISIGGCPQPNQPKLDPCCELHYIAVKITLLLLVEGSFALSLSLSVANVFPIVLCVCTYCKLCYVHP